MIEGGWAVQAPSATTTARETLATQDVSCRPSRGFLASLGM